VGFGAKEASVARAMLYSLAPSGSVIVVPDPLWLSETWASMLVGAAARGSHVVIIAPGSNNAPAPHPPVLSMLRDVLRRVIALGETLSPVMRASGGDIRVGIYASTTEVADIPGRLREIREGLARAPWITALIPFDQKTLANLDQALIRSEGSGRDGTRLARDEKPRAPQLHQKTQLIARPGAIAALVRQPGWDDVLARAMRAQSEQTAVLSDQIGYVDGPIDSAAVRATDAMFQAYERGLSAADRRRANFSFSVGAQNMDPRGAVLDGESTLLVTGFAAAAGVADLFYLMARTEWIADAASVDLHLPPQPGWMRRFSRLIRTIL
jgi:hypothetical protein